MKTIKHIKHLNQKAGLHFFSADTMRFFDSRIESEIIEDCFLITSEKNFDGSRRLFTVREIDWDTGVVETAKHSSFNQFKSLNAAKKWIENAS
jgi:hypothetical protein